MPEALDRLESQVWELPARLKEEGGPIFATVNDEGRNSDRS